MEEGDDFNLEICEHCLLQSLEGFYHFGTYSPFEDAATERVRKLRNDAADIEHRDSLGSETSESRVAERKQDHTWSESVICSDSYLNTCASP